MSSKLGKKKTKSQSYLSHDFIIANHGDIVSILAMIFVVGLLFKSTTPIASLFILLQHNVTTSDEKSVMYNPGFYDLFAFLFYTLMTIVIHAVIQEYGFDKYTKKMNLTKSRLGKLHYSGHLSIFFAVSVYYIGYLIISEGSIRSLSDLWEGYPHVNLTFWGKFFFIFQICYWLHNYPELYFQKVKKEEIFSRILHCSLFFLGIGIAYLTNFWKLCLLILLVQYATDFVYYLSRSYHIASRPHLAKVGFMIWDIVFIPARLLIICVTFLTLQYGLSKSSKSTFNLEEGNFNTRMIRLNGLLFIFFSQAYMMWNFISYHLKRRREHAAYLKSSAFTKSSSVTVTNTDALNQKKKEKKKTT